ncbi:hypothetical protein CLOM_g2554 [Closterium sp. NIES-68]|nr:hypothetical protein CLOM_g2554 [Closterium sp. NIES-68]
MVQIPNPGIFRATDQDTNQSTSRNPPNLNPINQDLPAFLNPFDNAGDFELGFPVRSLKELLLCRVMGQIREKPDWARKVTDDEIVEKWKAELTEPAADVHPDGSIDASKEYWSQEEASAVLSFLKETTTRPVKIDPALFAYAIAELRWQAASLSSFPSPSSPSPSPSSFPLSTSLSSLSLHGNPNILPSAVDGVFLTPEPPLDPALNHLFLDGVTRLESVPDDQIDYHPGSNRQVIDLVHPSLHCLVFGRTRVIPHPPNDPQDLTVLPWDELVSSLGEVSHPPPPGQPARQEYYPTGNHSYLSEKFQWLPAEIDVAADGQSAKFRSYINNLHPHEFAGMYRGLEHIFAAAFVPLFNRVLTESVQQRPERFIYDICGWYDEWKGAREYDKDDDDDYHQWLVDRQPKQPETPSEFAPPPPPTHVVDLRGRRLQVVVKVASIRLSPENPRYPGGTWHVEGMRNEHIVATGIYYFDSDNITESRLQFRHTVAEPEYEQNDNKGVARIYGLVDDGPLTQPLGSVRTNTPNLCLAFPNHFHHRVAPFELQDKTRPGHRKILVFFLVDPRERIISTARVPPQQLSWQRRELEKKGHPCSVLPGLALDLVAEGVGEGEGRGVGGEGGDSRGAAMTMEEAKQHREALMEERRALVALANEELFERPFSLCEH